MGNGVFTLCAFGVGVFVIWISFFARSVIDKGYEIEAREKQSIETRITAIEDQLILIGKGK